MAGLPLPVKIGTIRVMFDNQAVDAKLTANALPRTGCLEGEWLPQLPATAAVRVEGRSA
ncbi:MAG: hypothetical protein JWR69_3119 [Pedosphaera sp.]|nr:hypothetical protein [Pedosphaera sp.]